jgi:hypothetical protein
MNEPDYRREQQDERQRDMRDEAKQAAKEAAADNTQPRHWITKVAGGRDAYDPISGDTHHVSDYCPSDEEAD